MRLLTAASMAVPLVCCVCAGAARAAPDPSTASSNSKRAAEARTLDFSTHLSGFEVAPDRDDFIASFAVAPNATFGFGRFNAAPKRRTGQNEQPMMLQPKKTRRAAVGLSLKF